MPFVVTFVAFKQARENDALFDAGRFEEMAIPHTQRAVIAATSAAISAVGR